MKSRFRSIQFHRRSIIRLMVTAGALQAVPFAIAVDSDGTTVSDTLPGGPAEEFLRLNVPEP